MAYDAASRGLRRTRWWKKYTSWIRGLPDAVIKGVKYLRYIVFKGRFRQGRRSLVWSSKIQVHYAPPQVLEGVAIVGEEEDAHLPPGSRKTSHPDVVLKMLKTPSPSYHSMSSRPSAKDVGIWDHPRHYDRRFDWNWAFGDN